MAVRSFRPQECKGRFASWSVQRGTASAIFTRRSARDPRTSRKTLNERDVGQPEEHVSEHRGASNGREVVPEAEPTLEGLDIVRGGSSGNRDAPSGKAVKATEGADMAACTAPFQIFFMALIHVCPKACNGFRGQ